MHLWNKELKTEKIGTRFQKPIRSLGRAVWEPFWTGTSLYCSRTRKCKCWWNVTCLLLSKACDCWFVFLFYLFTFWVNLIYHEWQWFLFEKVMAHTATEKHIIPPSLNLPTLNLSFVHTKQRPRTLWQKCKQNNTDLWPLTRFRCLESLRRLYWKVMWTKQTQWQMMFWVVFPSETWEADFKS